MSFKLVGNELAYINASGSAKEYNHREIMDFDGAYRIFQGKEFPYWLKP